MRKKSSYGGQVEISALSHVLNRNINVYKSDGDNYTTAGLGHTINPNNRDNDILLFHNMQMKSMLKVDIIMTYYILLTEV